MPTSPKVIKQSGLVGEADAGIVDVKLLSGLCLLVKVGIMGNRDREQSMAAFLSDMENSPLTSHSLPQFNVHRGTAERHSGIFEATIHV